MDGVSVLEGGEGGECGCWDESVVEWCEDGDEWGDGEVVLVAHEVWLRC